MLSDIIVKFNLSKKGLIHIGAHWGEEAEEYDRIYFENILWIEADPDNYKILKNNISNYNNQKAINVLCSDKKDIVFFNITNNQGHSSSLLDFDYKMIKNIWKGMTVEKKIKLQSQRFQDLVVDKQIDIYKYTTLVLDVQGAELLVIKGFGKFLSNILLIQTEVNFKRLYKDSALFHQINSFLINEGFRRIYLSISDEQGEAVYLKTNQTLKKSYYFSQLIIGYLIEALARVNIVNKIKRLKGSKLTKPLESFYRRRMQSSLKSR
jgi:FkbM family methyltransferase